jgi:hypothetical protein
MKKNKKIKLALNKQTIAKLDNDSLKGVQGGKAQFLSIFHCSYTPSCLGYCEGSFTCEVTITSSK